MFPADEMDGDGRYTGKDTALPALGARWPRSLGGGRSCVNLARQRAAECGLACGWPLFRDFFAKFPRGRR